MEKIACKKCGKVMDETLKFCEGCGSDMTVIENRAYVTTTMEQKSFGVEKIFAILSAVCFGLRIILYLGITAFEIITYNDFLGHLYGIAHEAGLLFIALYFVFKRK